MDKRNGTILLLCAASVLLLVSLVTKGWFRGEGGGGKVGVSIWGTVEFCAKRGGKKACRAMTAKISKSKGKGKAQLIFGKTGMIIGMLSSIMLLVVSGLLGSRNPATKPAAMAALIGVAMTAVCGLLFLVLKQKGMPGVGYSVFLFFPAVAAGIASSVMAMRALDYLDAADHDAPAA